MNDQQDLDIEDESDQYDPYSFGGLRPGDILKPGNLPPDSIPLDLSGNIDSQDYSIDKETYRKWAGIRGQAFIASQNSQNETAQFCQHEPIDVGFIRTKIVCKKCNKDL